MTDCTFSNNVSTNDGGAIVCWSGNFLTLTRCTIEDNQSFAQGGAVFLRASDALLRGCTFSRNQAPSTVGGAMALNRTDSVVLVDCSFVENVCGAGVGSSGGNGGGIYAAPPLDAGTVRLINCRFIRNEAHTAPNSGNGLGGGVFAWKGLTLELTNCLFEKNTADTGAGLHLRATFQTTITNCTFAENAADSQAGGVFNLSSSPFIVRNTVLWGNTDTLSSIQDAQLTNMATMFTVERCCIQDDDPNDANVPFGGGSPNFNIDDDPLFVDSMAGNFRLMPCSPCIDAGDTPPVPPDDLDVDEDNDPMEKTPDLALNNRTVNAPAPDTGIPQPPFFPVVDMGGFEFQGVCEPGLCPVRGDGNGDGLVNGLDIQPLVNCLLQRTPSCLCVCLDMNADGDIKVDDIACFVDKLLFGTSDCETMFPCPFGFQPRAAGGDCNNSGIPDDVDIAGGASTDCNGNGWPDECEQDCNGNGVPDDCDIDPSDPDGNGEVSADCNNNGYPDECDLTLPLLFSLDCNENGIPDECDLRFGTSQDCNRNGFPDECDIASGVSADDNNNGIPDECDTGTQAQAGGGSDEAWAAFHEWCCQQSWGPPAEHSCSCQFQHYVDMLNELGLPLANPAAQIEEPAD